MRKILFALLVFASFLTTAAHAIEAKKAFSVKIIPTRAVNLEDQFRGILPNRPPFVPVLTQVSCGEPFEIAVFFAGATIRESVIKLDGKIVMTDANGKKTEIPFKTEIPKASGDVSGVFLLPQSLRVICEPDDPKGLMLFEVELTDRFSGKTANASASVEYGDPAVPKPDAKAFDKVGSYYRAPCPEYIVPAFREFLANLPKQKKREKANFNPLPQLAFFYFLLKENPQCVPAFAELFKTLHGEEKYMAGIVMAFVSEEAAKCLSPEQRKAIREQFREKDPFSFEKAVEAWQLDVCWAEFLVRGTKAPVMKIVNAMSLASDSVTIPEFKKIAKPTTQDRRKLMNGLTVMAAQWSLGSLVKSHPLIFYYVEAALSRGEVKDPVAAILAAKAVGIPVDVPKKKTP